jgi:N-methylhydantoinase A
LVLRIGIDVGGSFTDCVLLDEGSGAVEVIKVPSTPREPQNGFVQGLRELLSVHQANARMVSALVHGTTVGTNAVIERRGARTALITTRGFRDVLAIGTQQRPHLYDLRQQRPPELILRYLCVELDERIGPRGEVLTPLDSQQVREVLRRLVEDGVRSVAVCLLFSFANPAHERLVADIACSEFAGLQVSLSSVVCPEFREFVRASTTAVNAYIQPIISHYVGSVEQSIGDEGLQVPLHVMQSNGGIMSAPEARRLPVHLVSSGPAGGVMAGVYYAGLAGFEEIITLDMGGTTCDVCLVQSGQPHISPQGSIEGYPVRVPAIDVQSIGAGGGSITSVDRWGALKVGPQSAGADPGPACYARGGTRPTVTDANLVLGCLSEHAFLGGRMNVDASLSARAISEAVAAPLGLSVIEAARGIVQVSNATMLRLLRVVSVMRGHDPRDFALVAFGGAGPVQACALARSLGIRHVVIPPNPGVTSAFGLLTTDLRYTHSLSWPTPIAGLDVAHLARLFQDLADRGHSRFVETDRLSGEPQVQRSLDLRYVGQQFDLPVDLEQGELTPEHLSWAVQAFHHQHERIYGHAFPGEPVELVNLRVTVVGPISTPVAPLLERRTTGDAPRPFQTRYVCFSQGHAVERCPVYRRNSLLAGDALDGPCIVEQVDSTVVIEPDCSGHVDGYGSIVVSVGRPGSGKLS